MKTKAIALLALATLTCGRLALAANSQAEKDALTAANKWLARVDNGQFDKSYAEAASIFQNSVSRDQWVKQITAVRPPLGKVIKRTVKSEQYTKSLPGAPDGEYVVIQFDTQFEKKTQAIETITPMKEKNGTWRVSGYFIH